MEEKQEQTIKWWATPLVVILFGILAAGVMNYAREKTRLDHQQQAAARSGILSIHALPAAGR